MQKILMRVVFDIKAPYVPSEIEQRCRLASGKIKHERKPRVINMYAVEFQTNVRKGTIDIPEEYRDRFKAKVRVILISEEETAASSTIEQLLKNPIKIAGFQPMSREALHERF